MDILNTVEKDIMWPKHTLLNLVVLMGKPDGGGVRPIALMPMLYRLWTKARMLTIREWEKQAHGMGRSSAWFVGA